uniref:Protein kinase domain-containing protein n=1 Tax=Macrostomum lignano TaxID=282301 RepID=A0A1I8FNB6_9PLAT
PPSWTAVQRGGQLDRPDLRPARLGRGRPPLRSRTRRGMPPRSRSSSAVVDAKPRADSTRRGFGLRCPSCARSPPTRARIRCHLGYMQSDFSMVATFPAGHAATGAAGVPAPACPLRAAHLAARRWSRNGPLTGYTVYYAPHGGQFISRNAAAKETQIVAPVCSSPVCICVQGAPPRNQAGRRAGHQLDSIYDAGCQTDTAAAWCLTQLQDQDPNVSINSPDSESDRKLWFVIGGGFGLAIVLLIVAIANRLPLSKRRGSGRHRRRRRPPAQTAGGPGGQGGGEPDWSRGGSQSAAPGLARARGGAADIDRAEASTSCSTSNRRQTSAAGRENCLELRHLPQAGRGADGPVGGPFGRSSVHPPHHLGGGHLGLGGGRGFMGEPLLLDHPGGASPNPPGHFRNISSSGLYPPGTPPSYQPGAALLLPSGLRQEALPRRRELTRPTSARPALESPALLLVRHPSRSSVVYIGGGGGGVYSCTDAHAGVARQNGRSVNVTPDHILNPPRLPSLHGGQRSRRGGRGGSGGGLSGAYNGGGAGGGGGADPHSTVNVKKCMYHRESWVRVRIPVACLTAVSLRPEHQRRLSRRSFGIPQSLQLCQIARRCTPAHISVQAGRTKPQRSSFAAALPASRRPARQRFHSVSLVSSVRQSAEAGQRSGQRCVRLRSVISQRVAGKSRALAASGPTVGQSRAAASVMVAAAPSPAPEGSRASGASAARFWRELGPLCRHWEAGEMQTAGRQAAHAVGSGQSVSLVGS